MGPLLIKPAEMMLFYTGADNCRQLHQMTFSENPCDKAISFKFRMDETGPG